MTYESVYIVTWKPEYLRLTNQGESGSYRVVIRLNQGGFGEGVSDFVSQVKTRYLSYELSISMIDLPISEETFDRLFTIEEAREVVDLDETEN
ncbi:MAG TPA: hypothetical protein VFC63_00865 [Blastocatellia bacterium]|nr:hypothetical protein [Blastocatellia bacterium]